MSDINLTQLHDTGFIPVSSNAMSTSTVDNRNTGKTRDTKETAKLRCVEKLLAQIWPACLLSRNDSVEGERARRERSGWRPRQPPLQARDWVHRLVTRRALVPTGEGAGRQRPGRARSPLSTAWTRLSVFVGLLLVCPVNAAEEPLVLPVWPGAVPGDHGAIGPERVREPSEAPTEDAKWITGVTKPTITLFRPPKDKNTGTAILICPGGGYWNLAWDLEGEEVAAWFNTVGVTGLELKYRVPRRPGQPERLPAPGPLLDAQRAVSLVRSRAADWGIERIGILGFSAGGHLAVATATHFDQRAYEPVDEIDKTSCRPNFAVVVYPGYLIEQRPAGVEINKDVLAPYIRIPKETPPVFLVHASDDTMAGAENSVVLYLALKRANVATELHVYAHGGHGFGVRKSSLPCATWTDRCVAWLQNQGMLGTNAPTD